MKTEKLDFCSENAVAFDRCIGCQACVDICPVGAISFSYDEWGSGSAYLSSGTACVNCGRCKKICPAIEQGFNPIAENALAVISKHNSRTGSSGGVFYEMAKRFISDGGVVFGAAFDEELRLVHKAAKTLPELTALCKSKYLHSDMSGVYKEIRSLLASGRRVMFVGTPCQTGAVKNLFYDQFGDSLWLVDFLCHGTGTQNVFDACVRAEEAKLGGKITEFSFRSKSRKAEHSYSYFLKKDNKTLKKSGYSFEFPYYYQYLKYSIFNEACYSCAYAGQGRVGDITLGDFWGIQRYNKALHDTKGVSMISLNTSRGKEMFDMIKDNCEIYAYPLEYASDHNEAFKKPTARPKSRDTLERVLHEQGEAALVSAMSCSKVKKELIYAKIPKLVKKIYSFLRGRQ